MFKNPKPDVVFSTVRCGEVGSGSREDANLVGLKVFFKVISRQRAIHQPVVVGKRLWDVVKAVSKSGTPDSERPVPIAGEA